MSAMRNSGLKGFSVLIGFLGFVLGINISSSQPQTGDPDLPLPGSVLVNFCSSNNSEKLEYCEGYIEGTMQIWKQSTACRSDLGSDQSYCRGVAAAKSRIQEVLEACQDCILEEFRPNLDDPVARGTLFFERMQSFHSEMKTALEDCLPDVTSDAHYCAGFNAEVENLLTGLAAMYKGNKTVAPRSDGRGRAQNDAFLHLWASEEFYKIQPCIRPSTVLSEAKNALLDFVRERPDQLHDTTATIILARALYYSVCPGPSINAQPHMEYCTKWDYEEGQFGTRNTCDEAVFVQFSAPGKPSIERRLEPGEILRTGLTRAQTSGLSWMFTTCPVGYISSVPLDPAGRAEIAGSHYSCIKK